MKKAFLTAVTAFSLVAVPTMAAAAPVQTPLTQPARETVGGDSALRGGAGGAGFLVLIAAIIAIALGVAAAAHGSSRPNSP